MDMALIHGVCCLAVAILAAALLFGGNALLLSRKKVARTGAELPWPYVWVVSFRRAFGFSVVDLYILMTAVLCYRTGFSAMRAIGLGAVISFAVAFLSHLLSRWLSNNLKERDGKFIVADLLLSCINGILVVILLRTGGML